MKFKKNMTNKENICCIYNTQQEYPKQMNKSYYYSVRKKGSPSPTTQFKEMKKIQGKAPPAFQSGNAREANDFILAKIL